MAADLECLFTVLVGLLEDLADCLHHHAFTEDLDAEIHQAAQAELLGSAVYSRHVGRRDDNVVRVYIAATENVYVISVTMEEPCHTVNAHVTTHFKCSYARPDVLFYVAQL